MKRQTITYIILCFAFLAGHAQHTNVIHLFTPTLTQADNYFQKMAYRNAAELYLRIIEKDPNNLTVLERLGDCYRLLRDPNEAASWYLQAIGQKSDNPEVYYNYADIRAMNERYEEAVDWYRVYQALAPGDKRPERKIKFILNLDFYNRKSTLNTIYPLSINSKYSDFGFVPYDSGFIFISSRPAEAMIHMQSSGAEIIDESMFRYYFTHRTNATDFSEPRKVFAKRIMTYNQGPLSFFNDGDRRVIFGRNELNKRTRESGTDGKYYLNLYEATINANGDIVDHVPINNTEPSNFAHPTVSKDNKKIIFSSDRQGGYGGADLYYIKWENGKWSGPVNLGPEVNTEGDELYPFITNNNTLYFSSNGWGGFGGLDIYRTFQNGDFFTNAINVGTPLNSSSDDFAVTLDENERSGFFSSNRYGGVGSDDIYSFNISMATIVATVDHDKNIPITGAKVTLYDMNGQSIISKETNNQGYAYFDVPVNSEYILRSAKDGYSLEDEVIIKTGTTKSTLDSAKLSLWKHELFIEGRIFSNESQQFLPGATVTLLDKVSLKKSSILSDSAGHYIFPLRKKHIHKLTISKYPYQSSSFEINTSVIEGRLVNDVVLEEDFREKVVINYDYDKYQLKKEDHAKLQSVLESLKKNPEAHVTISAFADSRGSAVYNQNLSDKRAKSIVDIMVSKGIDLNRITARSFGESIIINQCLDGVDCGEVEHIENRRVEIKVSKAD